MKKILLFIALSAAFGAFAHEAPAAHEGGSEAKSGAIEYERESTFQIGIDGGYDSMSQLSLAAISAAVPLGESGFKIVTEYAVGRHGDNGSNVATIKGVQELFTAGRFEFGAIAGVARAVELDRSGNGWVAGGEVAYDLTKRYSLKVEATRFYGVGNLSDERSNIYQTGVIVKF